MLRRSCVFRTVGIFPLHLDPPNLDHFRVFKQILSDPTLNITKLVLLPLSHQAVTLQKSLHLSAMAGLALREFEPPYDETAARMPGCGAQAEYLNPHSVSAAAEEDSLQQTKDAFKSVVGVDTAVTDDGIIVAPTRCAVTGKALAHRALPRRKDVRVEINFTALEMHEDRIGVIEQIVRDEMHKSMLRQREKRRLAQLGLGDGEGNATSFEVSALAGEAPGVCPASSSSEAAAAAADDLQKQGGTGFSSKEEQQQARLRRVPSSPTEAEFASNAAAYSLCGVTLFQWLADVEVGGCLADRLWPRIAGSASSLPLTVLLPTGPAYPPPSDPVTEAVVSRVVGRWHGPVSVLNVRREWSSGFVRRRLFEEEGKCNSLVSGPILRYIDSHNLYRDERRQRQRYVAAVAENAIRLPLISLDDLGGGQASGSNSHHLHGSVFVDAGSAHDGGGNDGGVLAGDSQRANAPSSKWVSYAGSIPKLELHFDPRNQLARHIYDQLKTFQVRPGEQPDLIVPIGGDGYLMKCVRKFWMRFIPFFGVNAGHVGFLLNDAALLEEFFSAPLRLYQAPMLYCVAEQLLSNQERDAMRPDEMRKTLHGRQTRAFAFNDAWLERATGQTARFRICVNGVERTAGVRGDGVLVSTAAGSTAYAQALGGSPMPIDTPILQLVGSNCTWPARWRPVHLPEDVQIDLESCDTHKRPCRAFVDSVDLGMCKRMKIRASRVAGVQLAFTRSCDVQAKLYAVQFPSQ